MTRIGVQMKIFAARGGVKRLVNKGNPNRDYKDKNDEDSKGTRNPHLALRVGRDKGMEGIKTRDNVVARKRV